MIIEKERTFYQRLADARAEFHKLNLKKSGLNKFAGYRYFELADFVIPGMECLRNHDLIPLVSFTQEHAAMVIQSTTGEESHTIYCPHAEANLKGCHPIQNTGAVQTYQRRYLWQAALEIVEHDAVDSAPQAEEQAITAEQAQGLADRLEAVGGDLAKFCGFMGVKSLEHITVSDIDRAKALIAQKEEQASKAA